MTLEAWKIILISILSFIIIFGTYEIFHIPKNK
jgi:hypothetical protein